MGKEGLKDPQSDSLLKDNSSVRVDAGIEGWNWGGAAEHDQGLSGGSSR